MASGGSFRFRVLVGMTCVPLHARNAATAQTILGPSCVKVEVVRPRDVPDDDDREFFVTAWCLHPSFIPPEQIIFIPEPSFHIPVDAVRTEVPGLRYLVRVRLISFQDWNTPPPSPDGHDGDDDTENGDGDDGAGGADGSAPLDEGPSRRPALEDDYSGGRDSEADDSGDSNHNHYHPGLDRRRHGSAPPAVLDESPSTVLVEAISCLFSLGPGGSCPFSLGLGGALQEVAAVASTCPRCGGSGIPDVASARPRGNGWADPYDFSADESPRPRDHARLGPMPVSGTDRRPVLASLLANRSEGVSPPHTPEIRAASGSRWILASTGQGHTGT